MHIRRPVQVQPISLSRFSCLGTAQCLSRQTSPEKRNQTGLNTPNEHPKHGILRGGQAQIGRHTCQPNYSPLGLPSITYHCHYLLPPTAIITSYCTTTVTTTCALLLSLAYFSRSTTILLPLLLPGSTRPVTSPLSLTGSCPPFYLNLKCPLSNLIDI